MTKRYDAVLKQRIFEARYEQGYRYLDRCGDVMAILEDLLTEQTGTVWLPAEASPASARIKCPDLEITLAFSAHSLVVDQNPIADVSCDFSAIASSCLATVIGRFDLRKFRRLGARRVSVVPCSEDSIDAAEELSLQLVPMPPWMTAPNSAYAPRATETAFVFETPDRSKGIRVAVRPYSKVGTELQVDERLKLPPHHLPGKQREALLEQLKRQRTRQHDPEAGVAIDIDYFWMWPKEFTAKDFLEQAWHDAEKMQVTMLERHSTQ